MSPPATLSTDRARRALLEAADDAFHRRGVGAVNMAELRDRSGVSLRRIYQLYPTKADLVTGWLRHRHRTWTAWFEAEIATRRAAGATPVDAVFDTLADWLEATDHRGCGFLNTLAEAGELGEQQRAIIERHKRGLVETVAGLGPDPAALAVLIDGAIARSAAYRSTEPVDDARRAARSLWGGATGPAGGRGRP